MLEELIVSIFEIFLRLILFKWIMLHYEVYVLVASSREVDEDFLSFAQFLCKLYSISYGM